MTILKEHNSCTLPSDFDFVGFEKYLNSTWQNRHILYNEYKEEELDQESMRQSFISFQGFNGIKASQYIGFVQYKELNLCVYPKLFRELNSDNIELFYHHLIYWLSYCRRINFPFNSILAELSHANDFPEALIYFFAKRTLSLLRQYPYQQFELIEETLPQVKGRLIQSRYIDESLSTGNFHRLICEHEPFQFNNTLNKIIKAVARKLIQRCRFKETWYFLEQILFMLEEVDDDIIGASDCEKVRLNLMFNEYKECLDMCRFFLNEEQIRKLNGVDNQFCFLLPMNYIFEDYICGFIEDKFRLDYKSEYQYSGWLTDQKAFRIKNDIVLKDGKDQLLVIVDTKYKLRQKHVDSKKGISQPDLYQMMAYAVRRNCQKVLMLYPLMGGDAIENDIDIFTVSSPMYNDEILIGAADLQICAPMAGNLDKMVHSQLSLIFQTILHS